MSEPEHMETILGLLERIWRNNPHLRFNQLLYNLQYDYSQQNGQAGQVRITSSDGFERTGMDLFYLKDEDFIAYLQTVIASTNQI